MKTSLLFGLLLLGACDELPQQGNDLAVGCGASFSTVPETDPSIAVPADGGRLILHARADGTQNYQCTAVPEDGGDGGAGQTYAWTLIAPAANLSDCFGNAIGSHSAPTGAASPEWSSSDGSVVVGHKLAAFTPDATAIPWLLLAAASHSGDGVMTLVRYVQRQNTKGGLPRGTCDQARLDAIDSSPYQADYYFFGE